MICFSHPTESAKHVPWLLCMVMMTVLCSGCIASRASSADPAFVAIAQALKDEDKDPVATGRALEDNLDKVKDTMVIPLLLDYLKETNRHRTIHANNMGQAVFYLEQVTGIKSHIKGTTFGPIYFNYADLDRDINEWQKWWDANKDYVFWDEQAKALRVRPH